jgi:integrase
LYVNLRHYIQIFKMKYSIKFYPEKRKEVVTNVPVMLSVTYERQRMFYYTGKRCNVEQWDTENSKLRKNQITLDGKTSTDFNAELTKITSAIDDLFKVYDVSEIIPTPDQLRNDLKLKLGKVVVNKEPEVTPQNFFETFAEFLEKHKLSIGRKNHFNVVKRALQRYELYTSKITNKPFKLSLDTLTSDMLRDIENFLGKEVTIFKKMPEIYEAIPESRDPIQRGQNTISGMFTKIRTFILWSIDAGKTLNDPFKGFIVDECVYGTPYYISIDERNMLYKTDLSHRPQLAIQRDIFVFQCLIGSRVADLYKMTKSSIINGAVEYIPRKSKDGRPITVRVPLNTNAKEILSRYADNDSERLFPFIAEQKYNVAIKAMFGEAKLTRMVTVVNPTTREENKRPLNELASSHLARRCFIGNLYKQVKDPNLVGALSGHKEGSKAFARYREIDEEMKIDLVSLLD